MNCEKHFSLEFIAGEKLQRQTPLFRSHLKINKERKISLTLKAYDKTYYMLYVYRFAIDFIIPLLK